MEYCCPATGLERSTPFIVTHAYAFRLRERDDVQSCGAQWSGNGPGVHQRRRRDTLLRALERHLGRGATWTVPGGGHHIWVTLREPVDERALYAEALRAGVTF